MTVIRPNAAGRTAVKGARDVLSGIRRLVAAGDIEGAEACLQTVDQLLDAGMHPEESLPGMGYESFAGPIGAQRAEVAEIRASFPAA